MVAIAAIVPLGIDSCASLKSPDLFEPAIIPLEQQNHKCIHTGVHGKNPRVRNWLGWEWQVRNLASMQQKGEVITSSCHVSKIFGWQQTKNSLKKVNSHCFKLHRFCQILAKFSELNPNAPYLSLESEKETFCVVFSYSVKRAREIKTFHVAVMQRRLKNMQKRDARAKLLFS